MLTETEIEYNLSSIAENTISDTLDLGDFSFSHVAGQGMRLNSMASTFTLSPLATEQLCKAAGVPHTFVAKNPPELNNTILQHWYPLIKQKTKRMRWYESEEGPVIRCILDSNKSYADYAQYFQVVKDTLNPKQAFIYNPDDNSHLSEDELEDLKRQVALAITSPDHSIVTSYEVKWEEIKKSPAFVQVEGGGNLQPHLYMRIQIPALEFTSGSDWFNGMIDVWLTDCGGLNMLSVDPGIYFATGSDQSLKKGLLFREDGKSKYTVKDTDVDPLLNFRAALTEAFKDLTDFWPTFKAVVQKSKELQQDRHTLIKAYKENREVPKAFITKLDKDLEANQIESFTQWEFMGWVLDKAAQIEDPLKRGVVESFAAKQMGFSLE